MGTRRPQQASAGLQFPSSVNVVLKLRTDRELKLVSKDRDLILQKNTINVVGLMMRKEIHGGYCLGEIAGAPSGAHTPDDVLPRKESQMMNEIDVKRVTSFAQLRTKTVGSIVVGLDLDIASVHRTPPAPKNVAARNVLSSD